MKPVKSMAPLSGWLLRISVCLFLLSRYRNVITSLNAHSISLQTLCICLYCLFAVLLVPGGVGKAHTLTIVSAVVVALFSMYFAYAAFHGSWLDGYMLSFVLPFAVGIHFIANGNK